jgi:hypothetical protein
MSFAFYTILKKKKKISEKRHILKSPAFSLLFFESANFSILSIQETLHEMNPRPVAKRVK